MDTVHVRSPRRSSLSAALLGMAAALGIGPSVPDAPPLGSVGHRPNRRRWFHRAGVSKPHQGPRECARRRGGQDWADFKARDRIRRGLPVSWPYQTGEG